MIDTWKNVELEKPKSGEIVLVSTDLLGYFVAWWADDWNCWCYAGSRDIVRLSVMAKLWKTITPPNIA